MSYVLCFVKIDRIVPWHVIVSQIVRNCIRKKCRANTFKLTAMYPGIDKTSCSTAHLVRLNRSTKVKYRRYHDML